MARPLAILRRAALDLLYLAIGLVTGIVSMVVWIAGLSLVLSLLVFVVGLPVALGVAYAMRWTAEVDRRSAALVHGTRLAAVYRPSAGRGFLAALRRTGRDPQTWRDLAWHVVHSVVGVAFGAVAIAVVTGALGLLSLPIWYWSIPDGGVDFGLWHADTLPVALATALLSIPAGALALVLLRGMAIAAGAIAAALLGRPVPRPALPAAAAGLAPQPRRDPAGVLALHAALSGLVGLLLVLLWAATGGGTFWPVWPLLGLGAVLALHAMTVGPPRTRS